MWTRTWNVTNYASKTPLQMASSPHPLRRARSLSRELVPSVQLWMKHLALPSELRKFKFELNCSCKELPISFSFEWNCSCKELPIHILSTHKTFWFRNVPHHFQIICTFAICREFNNLYKLWWTAYTTCFNLFTAFSSWCESIKQLVSFIAIKSTKQESVSESVSEWQGNL